MKYFIFYTYDISKDIFLLMDRLFGQLSYYPFLYSFF